MEVGPSRYWFIFISVVLHKLAHNALVWLLWYGGLGACDSPQLRGIGGNYIEKANFWGIACAEFELAPMRLMETGIQKENQIFVIGESQFPILLVATEY